MAPNKGRNRAAEFEELLEPAAKDFDPEADEQFESDSDDDLGEQSEDDQEDPRSHYVDVAKSKLRKPKTATLGPQYRGSRIDRDAFDDNEDDDDGNDPFSKGFEVGSSDEEDAGSVSGREEEDDVEDDEDGKDEDDDTPDTDMSEDETGIQAEPFPGANRAELRQIMAEEHKAVAASISQATKLDAEKGRAVKRQRKAFDGLLSTRIRLQKALVGINNMAVVENMQVATHEAVEAAETAAYSLWSSLNDFREELRAGKSGEKRKSNVISQNTPAEELWSVMQHQDADSIVRHEANLQKWSAKTRGTSATPAQSRINNTEAQATILDVVREHLSNSERLIKRAHTPRSCAPLHLEKKVETDEKIYDDADFYALLLKELLEQKSQDTVTASNVDLSFQLRREAKTKKNVDTRASKGRKLRYTVHEKLQNFMAPEDRSTWGDRQSDELFGSLFGQKLGLGEVDEREDEEMEEDIDPQEAGLILFRS